jgi:precorrin-3B synthase
VSAPQVKGRCPGALRPMLSGDGLVVRVRPRLARLTAAQARGLAGLADRYGSGLIDLTNRANLQIRGVAGADHRALLDGLDGLGLLDADPETERRRNILVTPFWAEGDLTARLARAVAATLPELPEMPAKVGFAIDTGPRPLLAGASADFRVERGAVGLVLRADGQARGRAVSEADAPGTLAELAAWFDRHRTESRRRMAQVVQATALPAGWAAATPRRPAPAPAPGRQSQGVLLGAPFGQIEAGALRAALEETGAAALRVTPWRLVLLEGAEDVPEGPFIATPGDPLLTTDACPGAPFCPQATVETRALARALAPRTGGNLHVSGCAKGCARSGPAAVTLTGRAGRFDLVRDGRAWDGPQRPGLRPADILAETEL